MKEYYVYAHIRLDKNQIFYVGKGIIRKGNKYRRAKSLVGRNSHWKNIINKSKWSFIVLRYFTNEIESLLYEKRIIEMFGIHNEGGQLCNIIKDSTDCITWNKMGSVHSMKKVYKYSLEGYYIEEYKSTKEAGKLNNCDCSSIAKVCRKELDSCKNFRWSYEKIEKLPDLCNRIYQYSTSGEFLREFLNPKEARMFMGGNFDLERACEGKIHTSKGFQWRYYKADKLEEVTVRKHKVDKLKILLQYDENMNLIASHKGYEAACKAVNATSSAIASALSGRNKTCKGFIWKYGTNVEEC